MAFDGLHIIWTTHHSRQPHHAGGNWSLLYAFYQQLASEGHFYELSAPFPERASRVTPGAAVSLTLQEQNAVENHLTSLLAPNGDRIAGGLPLACCGLNSTAVHLLFIPALPSHNQIIGRLKSKTASQLLILPERNDQRHIWSGGYWFANLNGAEALVKVERFIEKQRGY